MGVLETETGHAVGIHGHAGSRTCGAGAGTTTGSSTPGGGAVEQRHRLLEPWSNMMAH